MTVSDQTLRLNWQSPQRRSYVVGIARIGLLALLLAVWEYAYFRLGELYFASPVDVAYRIFELFRTGAIWPDIVSTLYVTALGCLFGWTFGILVPLVLSASARATAAIEPFVLASMGIPKFALMPLLIIWFGIGVAPKVVVVALMTFYVIFITTYAGLRSLDRRLIDTARILGASRRVIATEIIGRSLIPFLSSGLKIALPRALSATIVGEFLVSDAGLGFMIEHSRQMADTVGVFSGIAVVVFLVFGLNAGLEAIHRRFMHWQPENAGQTF